MKVGLTVGSSTLIFDCTADIMAALQSVRLATSDGYGKDKKYIGTDEEFEIVMIKDDRFIERVPEKEIQDNLKSKVSKLESENTKLKLEKKRKEVFEREKEYATFIGLSLEELQAQIDKIDYEWNLDHFRPQKVEKKD